MNFRSSNSVAALALLIASGGCVLFAPTARAGERLEFSTAAILLAVPHPDVETKEPKKMTGTEDIGAGIMSGVDMGSQQMIVTTRSKSKSKYDLNSKDKYGLDSGDKYDLDSNPLLGEDQDKRDGDDWLTAPPEPNRMTNSGSLNMPHEWDAKNSDNLFQRKNETGFEAGQDSSRFGIQIGADRDNAWDGDRNARDGERYGRDSSNDKNSSFWAKTLNHDSLVADRFDAARSATSKDESENFGFSAHEPRKAEPAPAADSTHNMALPPGFGNFTPLDDSQNRQTGEQFSYQPGVNQELRAWEPLPSGRLPARSTSKPGQNSPTRVVAPNRPSNLPFPKRPDSPY